MRKNLTRLLLILLAVLVQPHAVVADNMTPARISGQVVYHERMVMPPGTTIRVTLEDVSRADVRAVVLGEQIITPDSGVPVAFTLQYDAAKIDPRYSYALRAQIRDAQGKLLWTTTTHSGVLTRGFPSDDIQLVVEPVARETRRIPRTAVFDCSGLEIIATHGAVIETG
jgi:putative lipoprotein